MKITPAQKFIIDVVCKIQEDSAIRVTDRMKKDLDDSLTQATVSSIKLRRTLDTYNINPAEYQEALVDLTLEFQSLKEGTLSLEKLSPLCFSYFEKLLNIVKDEFLETYPVAINNLFNRISYIKSIRPGIYLDTPDNNNIELN